MLHIYEYVYLAIIIPYISIANSSHLCFSASRFVFPFLREHPWTNDSKTRLWLLTIFSLSYWIDLLSTWLKSNYIEKKENSLKYAHLKIKISHVYFHFKTSATLMVFQVFFLRNLKYVLKIFFHRLWGINCSLFKLSNFCQAIKHIGLRFLFLQKL